MHIIGIDEVGRGCWAGPLVAGAVLLDQPISGLTDSKLLSKKRREILAAIIHTEAVAYGLGWVSAAELDRLGITIAVKTAMQRSLTALRLSFASTLTAPAQTDSKVRIIIDGNINYLPDEPFALCEVKADLTVPAVSAASIIAKVARDRYMQEAALHFPGYEFERHVGYGTAVHRAALERLGTCELHRLSFKPIQALKADLP